jgi:hypothetical protein
MAAIAERHDTQHNDIQHNDNEYNNFGIINQIS